MATSSASRALSSLVSLSLSRSMCPLSLSLSAHTPRHHIFPILLSHTDLCCLVHRQHISCRPIRFFFCLLGQILLPHPSTSFVLVGAICLSLLPQLQTLIGSYRGFGKARSLSFARLPPSFCRRRVSRELASALISLS
jgi:hypothetical protein